MNINLSFFLPKSFYNVDLVINFQSRQELINMENIRLGIFIPFVEGLSRTEGYYFANKR